MTKETWDSWTTKRIGTLHPMIRESATSFINEMSSLHGVFLRVTSAFRSAEEQDELFAIGRTRAGNIVTNARAGESYHNYGLALDVVEMSHGHPCWGTQHWDLIAETGKQHGFEWGGDWIRPDRPHFQKIFGLSIDQLKDTRIEENGYILIDGQNAAVDPINPIKETTAHYPDYGLTVHMVKMPDGQVFIGCDIDENRKEIDAEAIMRAKRHCNAQAREFYRTR